MLPFDLKRTSGIVITLLAAAGLMVAVGCQSSPEPDADDQAQPVEQADPYDDPYEQSEQHQQHEPDPHQPPEGEQPPEGHQPPPEQGQPQDPMAPQPEPVEVDDEKVEEFVDAVGAASEVDEAEYEQRMNEAETPQEIQQIEQEFFAEIEGAIEESGMDVQEFQQIGLQVGQDPELNQQVEQELEDRGKGDLLEPPAGGGGGM